jgi:hypothetical protein
MSVDSSIYEDREAAEETTTVGPGESVEEEEEEEEEEKGAVVGIPPKLAAQLVCALLGAILFDKGQIPTYAPLLCIIPRIRQCQGGEKRR